MGVKLTDTPQLVPAVTVMPQLRTNAKSPDAVMLVRFSRSTPVFVSDTSCGGAVVLIVCAGNVSEEGNTAMPDAVAVIADGRARAAEAVAAVDTVAIVSVDVAPAVAGLTIGGSNVHVVCGGRFPLAQLNVTSEL